MTRVAADPDGTRRPLLVVGATDLELDGIASALAGTEPSATAWGPCRRGARGGATVVDR